MSGRKSVSLRRIAEASGCSIATVSEALRDSTRVRASTKNRVLEVARMMNYTVDPKVQAMMSAIRCHGTSSFRGSIAVVDILDPDLSSIHPFHRPIFEGICECAERLGFATELFIIDRADPGQGVKRLDRIIKARGIDGLIVLPFTDAVDFSCLDFGRVSSVSMDFCLVAPKLHHVYPDHHSSIIEALYDLSNLGYKRPGLYMLKSKDSRLKYRWTTGFQSYHLMIGEVIDSRAAVVVDSLDEKHFINWFNDYRPDVVLGHFDLFWDWLEKNGNAVPEEVGFFCLNRVAQKSSCCGLDLNPRQLGVVAAEAVVDLINRGEVGVPEHPKGISVMASRMPGDSLRAN